MNYGIKSPTKIRPLEKLGLILAFMLCIAGVAQAQSTRVTPCDPATPNNAICISWGAVTQGTNNESLTGVTYRVERKFGSGAFAQVATALTALQFYDKNLPVGNYVYRAYANCTNAGCIESAPSNEANRSSTNPPIQPNAPVIIIAATIRANGPPIYRIIQQVRLKPNEVVFVAPASMRPVFASR